jgi:hypothetical protein
MKSYLFPLCKAEVKLERVVDDATKQLLAIGELRKGRVSSGYLSSFPDAEATWGSKSRMITSNPDEIEGARHYQKRSR